MSGPGAVHCVGAPCAPNHRVPGHLVPCSCSWAPALNSVCSPRCKAVERDTVWENKKGARLPCLWVPRFRCPDSIRGREQDLRGLRSAAYVFWQSSSRGIRWREGGVQHKRKHDSSETGRCGASVQRCLCIRKAWDLWRCRRTAIPSCPVKNRDGMQTKQLERNFRRAMVWECSAAARHSVSVGKARTSCEGFPEGRRVPRQRLPEQAERSAGLGCLQDGDKGRL